jgi:hypothetical protein
MISKLSAERYQSAKEVAEALEEWLRDDEEQGKFLGYSSVLREKAQPPRPARHEPTRADSSPSEETELELAPLDEEKPPARSPGKRTDAAKGDSSKQMPSAGEVASASDTGTSSSSQSKSKGADSRTDSGQHLLDDLPELPPPGSDLMAALAENSATSPTAPSAAAAAPAATPRPFVSRIHKKPAPKSNVAMLLDSAWFWIGSALLIVIVLIVAIMRIRPPTEATRRQPSASTARVSPASTPEAAEIPPAEAGQPSTAEEPSPSEPPQPQPPEEPAEKPAPAQQPIDPIPAVAPAKDDAKPKESTAEKTTTPPQPAPQQATEPPQEKPEPAEVAPPEPPNKIVLLAGITKLACRLTSFDSNLNSKLNLMITRKAEETTERVGMKSTEDDSAVMYITLTKTDVDDRVRIEMSAELKCRVSDSQTIKVWEHRKEEIGTVSQQALESDNAHVVLRSGVGHFFNQFLKDHRQARTKTDVKKSSRQGAKTPPKPSP